MSRHGGSVRECFSHYRLYTEWTLGPHFARKFPFRGVLRAFSLQQTPSPRSVSHTEVASVHGKTTPSRTSRRRVARHLTRQQSRRHLPQRRGSPEVPLHLRRGRPALQLD